MFSIIHLFESKKKEIWRPRAEVYIIKDGNLIVGISPKWKGYIIPGGGVDPGETPENTAKREALEEIGVKCKNLKLISTIKIKHSLPKPTGNKKFDENVAKRVQEFTGSFFSSFVGDFDGYDFSYQKKDQLDRYKSKEVSFDDAIDFFQKHKENCTKNGDIFNSNKANYVLKILKKYHK